MRMVSPLLNDDKKYDTVLLVLNNYTGNIGTTYCI